MAKSLAKKLVLLAVCGFLLLTVGACGGGGAEVKSEVTTTTVGQQLIDLKKALDTGAMTQQEYEQQRKKILEQK
jgi:hypothetical protein